MTFTVSGSIGQTIRDRKRRLRQSFTWEQLCIMGIVSVEERERAEEEERQVTEQLNKAFCESKQKRKAKK